MPFARVAAVSAFVVSATMTAGAWATPPAARVEHPARAARATYANALASGRSLEVRGRLVDAMRLYGDAAAAAEREGVGGNEAREAFAAVAVRVPRFIPVGALPAGATLLLDGSAYPGEVPVEGILVDPGVHEVTVRADGRVPWRKRYTFVVGESKRVGLQAGAPVGSELSRPRPLNEVRVEALPTSPYASEREARRADAPPVAWPAVEPLRASTPVAPLTGDHPPRPTFDCAGDACRVPEGPEANDPQHALRAMTRAVSGGNSVALLATGRYLLLTAPAPQLLANARVGATMIPTGGGYVAITGKW